MHTGRSTIVALTFAVFWALTWCRAEASAELLGPAPYLSTADSPFAPWTFDYFYLEDFEDGLLNTPGVAASTGAVLLSGAQTDSVDADDGSIDGSGSAGSSFYSTAQGQFLEFTFDAGELGQLPTHAGLVWTDVGFATPAVGFDEATFEAFDANDVPLGVIGPVMLGDGLLNGSTGEDRFIGAVNTGGIRRIRLTMTTSADWEMDHLQYGFSPDCNTNGVPDASDIATGTSADCDSNGVPDECEADFDGDALIDACDPDIDNDGVANTLDVCDFTPLDVPPAFIESDGGVRGDIDDDCDVDLDDLAVCEACFAGPNQPNPNCDPQHFVNSDLDQDNDADLHDFALFQRVYRSSLLSPPPIATLSAFPDSIVVGESSTLTWHSENANTCVGAGFSTGGLTFGSAVVTPTVSTTYTLTCAGPGGATSAQITIAVSQIPPPGEWYVATNGIDNTSCGAEGSPCATVQYVLDNKVTAGDTIFVAPGEYPSQSIHFIGANHGDVTLTGSDPGNRPLIQGTDVQRARIAVDADGVTIAHLRIRGAEHTWDGFDGVVVVGAYDVTIENNEIWNGGAGILLYVTKRVVIRNNDIHDGGVDTWPDCFGDADHHGIAIVNFSEQPPATSWEEGVVVDGNLIYRFHGDGMQEVGQGSVTAPATEFLTQSNNIVFNNCEQGFDYKGTRNVQVFGNDIYDNGFGGVSSNDSDGAVDYQNLNYWIYNNTIHDHDGFAILSQEGDDGNWYIWNNVFYENTRAPQFNYGVVTEPPSGSAVAHNVFINNNRTSGAEATGIYATRSVDVIIKNNVFYNNGVGSLGNIYSGSIGDITNNFVYPVTPGQTGANPVTTSDPGLVSLTLPYDFHLLPDSTLIDAGIALPGDSGFTISVDRDGVVRPQGAGWDIGAFELMDSP